MKQCEYCGSDVADQVATCSGCGTELTGSSGPRDTAPRVDPSVPEWFGRTLRFVGILFVLVMFYLMSFGPVARFSSTRTLTTGTGMAVSPTGPMMTTTLTVRYPLWVGVLYYPAVRLSGNRIYASYLRWWDEQFPPSPPS